MAQSNGNGSRLNIQLLAAVAGLVVSIITILAAVHFTIANPLATQIELNAEKQGRDHATLLKEIERLRGDLELTKDHATSTSEKFKEIETQFGTVSKLRNAQREGDYRLFGLLWNRVYNEPLPIEPYYPLVGNHN